MLPQRIDLNPTRRWILLVTVLTAIIWLLLSPPIPQDPLYHRFIDQRPFMGIDNFYNVVSNLIFLLPVLTIHYYQRHHPALKNEILDSLHTLLGVALLLLVVTSAYYHSNPSNETLQWDRLAMSIIFMLLLCIAWYDYISPSMARRLAVPLVIAGLASVLYWYWREQSGDGDLRPYILVQFVPLMIIIELMIMRGNLDLRQRAYMILSISYILAKLCELNDLSIFSLTNEVISGHTLKHLFAGAGLFFWSVYIQQYRVELATSESV